MRIPSRLAVAIAEEINRSLQRGNLRSKSSLIAVSAAIIDKHFDAEKLAEYLVERRNSFLQINQQQGFGLISQDQLTAAIREWMDKE